MFAAERPTNDMEIDPYAAEDHQPPANFSGCRKGPEAVPGREAQKLHSISKTKCVFHGGSPSQIGQAQDGLLARSCQYDMHTCTMDEQGMALDVPTSRMLEERSGVRKDS